MAKSLLDTLPEDLAFLAPAVRDMLRVRKAVRPAVDARKEPERALSAELEASFDDDERIVGAALRHHYRCTDRGSFVMSVQALQLRLLQWLEPQKRRPMTSERGLLFAIVGMLGYPEEFLVQKRRRKARR